MDSTSKKTAYSKSENSFFSPKNKVLTFKKK